MMIRNNYLLLILAFAFAGCSSTGTWKFVNISDIPFEKNVPGAKSCVDCHKPQYDTWKKTSHADTAAMAKISVSELKECGACHDKLNAHMVEPEKNKPQSLAGLNKSGINELCGKCHYNKDVFGGDSINPELDHGLFSSAGFDKTKKHQLSCLDCHKGHGDRNDMMKSLQANICFKCHNSAMVTMGVFQPLNYLVAGKLCVSCHAPHGTTKLGQAARMTVGVTATCAACHIP